MERGGSPEPGSGGRKADIHVPTSQSQRPHFTGDGHTKPILTEVKDQVLLGLWTCRVLIHSISVPRA